MRRFPWLFAGLAAVAPSAHSQARVLSPGLQRYASVNSPAVAIVHAKLIDGTGRAVREDQTIVIRGEKIETVGPSATTTAPAGAHIIDATGKTLIPGIVGLHDHIYYNGMRYQGSTYPMLYLSAGVTTIRTTGSVDSYGELNLKRMIDSLVLAGPEIVVTGPYLQGTGAGGAMRPLSGPESARRMVRYWAEEGVTWFKAYTTISRAELGAAIDEAHKLGVKVTAHLCSVGYREAAALGIDALEHGMLANYEYYREKQPDACPVGKAPDSSFFLVDINGADVQRTIREMVAKKVSLTSTLAVFELNAPSRMVPDPRVAEAVHRDLHPGFLTRVYQMGQQMAGTPQDSVARRIFKNAMAFERAFVKAGGLLGAGSDPCCGPIIAGYGDQRNYELLIEAGFSPEETIQIMTSNGAKVLGFDKRVGTVAPGMQADLVLLTGDLARTPTTIRNTEIVFRRGIGFDSARLREAIRGRVGY